ncbi:MAG: outer membrane lipoprotein carrier protein LolA [Geobacter sp.]|nr:outer membrane lipoprotein carrier protein LolA [Geobacter sp.]
MGFFQQVTVASLLIVWLLAGKAEARQIPPLEGLEALRTSFAGVSDFSADIVQEKQLSLMKRKLVSTGIVRFRKPSLFFMELNPPHASRLLLNDAQLTLYLPREKSSSQVALPPDQGLSRWFGLLARPLTALPEGVDVRADRQGGLLTVAVTPKGSGQVREFSVTLQEDGILRKLVIVERGGDRTVITFSRMRRNTGLTDRDFKLP